MIQSVFLDLDNTILDFDRAEKRALTATLTHLGIPVTDAVCARYSQINLSQWKLLELGKISREQVKLDRYRLLFEELGSDASPRLAASIYEEHLGEGHFFLPGAEEMLQELFASFSLYLVTNGTARVQKGRIQSAGLSRFFRGIFISEEIGANKPHPDFFRACFEQIPDFDKKKAAILGDSLSSDIQGGINSEITTVWFNPHGEIPTAVRPDYTIQSLKEAAPLLRSL